MKSIFRILLALTLTSAFAQNTTVQKTPPNASPPNELTSPSKIIVVPNGGSITLNAGANLTTNGNVTATGATSYILPGITQRATPSGTTYLPLPFFMRQSWKKIYPIANGSVAQERILTLGDSMAGIGGNSLPQYLFAALAQAYGDLGTGVAPTLTAAGAANTGDATASNDPTHYTRWPTSLPPSTTGSAGTLTYGRGGGVVRCDTIKVYYIREPGAGTFKVQTSTDFSSWSDEAGYTNVSAANGSMALGIITITKTLGNYAMRVWGLTGTVYFLNNALGQFRNSAEPGIEALSMAIGGLELPNANLSNAGVLTAWLQDAAIDTIVFEMKESAATFAAALVANQARFDAGTPGADWIYIGSSPTSGANGDTDQLAQNAILLSHAITSGKGYFDGYAPMKNYATALALGWIDDGIHRTAEGNAFEAGLISSATHFFDHTLATYPGSVSGTEGNFTSTVRIGSGKPGTPTVEILSEPIYHINASIKAQRYVYITRTTGTIDGNAWGLSADGNYPSFTPVWFRIGLADPGPYLQADSATTLAARSAPFQSSIDFLMRNQQLEGYTEGVEIADPAAPSGNRGRAYFRDNGSGKTQFVVRFPTGAIQVIATEP